MTNFVVNLKTTSKQTNTNKRKMNVGSGFLVAFRKTAKSSY